MRPRSSLENSFAYSLKFNGKIMIKRNNILCIAMLAGILCGCGNKHQYIPKDIEAVEVEIVRFDNAQLGQAIMNRLLKAAGHSVKEV